MKPIKLNIQIEAFDELKIDCYISNEIEENRLEYNIANAVITLSKENFMATTIRNNQAQFEKVIRSAIKGNIQVGQIISCVFIEGFNFLKQQDFASYICVDRRDDKLDIKISDTGTLGLHKIYSDGSFVNKTNRAGYGGFIEAPDGSQEIFSESFNDGSSNLMELLAVTEGLQRLQSTESFQVYTDSRFVIRGLAQWVHFWRHNNWQTAYCCDVKYATNWQDAYHLCEDKYIEFKWIKGHSGNEEQDFCHQLAKASTR